MPAGGLLSLGSPGGKRRFSSTSPAAARLVAEQLRAALPRAARAVRRLGLPAHELARRVALDGRGAVDRDRVAAAVRHPGDPACGRLATALLHAAVRVDGRRW